MRGKQIVNEKKTWEIKDERWVMKDENRGNLGNISYKNYNYMPLNQLMGNFLISTPFMGIRLNLSLFFSSISSYLIALE